MSAPNGSEGTRDALLPASPVPERIATDGVERKSRRPAISCTGLFALLFMRVQHGLRRIAPKHPLTPQTWMPPKGHKEQDISCSNPAQSSWRHVPRGGGPPSDELVEECVRLAIAVSRMSFSVEQVAVIEKELAEERRKKLESERPIPRSLWARIVAAWKKRRKGVQR